MRSLLLAMFILVAPLPLDGLVDEENLGGCEVILQLSGGDVWGQTEWEALEPVSYTHLTLPTSIQV